VSIEDPARHRSAEPGRLHRPEAEPGRLQRPDPNPQNLRQTLEADPLGLANRHRFDDDQPPPGSPTDQRGALLRLGLVVGAVIALGFLARVGETVLLVLALLVCILLHEAGHLFTAKLAGMKVTEFFVGFGHRLWSIRRGETEYGIKALPLGGYCRIIGMNNLEEVDPADESRTYRSKGVLRRLMVVSAGSAMHFLIAICVLFAMFFWTGDNSNYVSTLPASNPIAEIDGLTTGASPAQQAGFHLDDRIVAVDGRHFATWNALTSYMDAQAGRRLDVTVDRGGQLIHLFPTPVARAGARVAGPNGGALAAPGAPAAFVGIAPSLVIHSSFGQSLSRAGGAWVHVSALTIHAFAHLVSFGGISHYYHMLTNQKAADQVGGSANNVRFSSPVGVVRMFHQAGQSGLPTVLYLIAIINLSLGIFNLLPLLPLDGGHVSIALYEGARSVRRPYRVDVTKLLPIFYLGIALIAFLGLSSLFLDLRDLSK
jgi:membrane-associated protease RseP (regulator of RpoE activity)